jgi:hypothetical protein
MEGRLRSIVVRIREGFLVRPRLVLAAGVAAGMLLLWLSIPKQTGTPPHQSSAAFPVVRGTAGSEFAPRDGMRARIDNTIQLNAEMPTAVPSKLYSPPLDSTRGYHEPQVGYSAELNVATREFAHARSSLEEILERHHGYVAKLRMVGEPTGSTLSATLRVPSSEYRFALAELKGVGAVEHEEEAADEITQQHSELEARLVNAQNEEQRIQRMLQDRDDKSGDFGSLERQVAILRGEIERIEAERAASRSQVWFANIFFSLREERNTAAEGTGAKLRSAAMGGLNDAVESVSSILLFVASRGPLLVLWAVLIYFPARYFWRRRSALAFREAQAAKNS